MASPFYFAQISIFGWSMGILSAYALKIDFRGISVRSGGVSVPCVLSVLSRVAFCGHKILDISGACLYDMSN